MTDPVLDLKVVEALLRDLRGETPTDAKDVEPEDAALAIEALLALMRETRTLLTDLLPIADSVPPIAVRIRAVLGKARDEP